VALTHGNLTVHHRAPQVSQPEGFSKGETVVVPAPACGERRRRSSRFRRRHEFADAGRRPQSGLGLKPTDIIAVPGNQSAGGLQAELVVQ
jgi:flagellar basal body P-ring protein FlgI